jgi:hypothetical protein
MLLLIIVIALLAHIKGRAIGAKSQKAKILKAISRSNPNYLLGHLNQDLAIQEELEYEQKNRWQRMISDTLKRFKEL